MQDIDLWDWRQRVAALYQTVRSGRDAAASWRIWCETRAGLFRDHPQSPIEATERAGYNGPSVFGYDPALRLTVALEAAPAERLTVPTGADGVTAMHAFARTVGLQPALGGELTLYWIEGYGGGVFLPFTDATSGAESYGGGRYLIDSIKGADPAPARADGRLTLDFNFAYFPSCAYSRRWMCPLAPPGNRLAAPVRGGERL